MRNLLRSHAVSVAYLHDIFTRGDTHLQYEQNRPSRCRLLHEGVLERGHVGPYFALIGVGDSSTTTAKSEIHCWANARSTKAALREAAEAVVSAAVGSAVPSAGQTAAAELCRPVAAHCAGQAGAVSRGRRHCCPRARAGVCPHFP